MTDKYQKEPLYRLQDEYYKTGEGMSEIWYAAISLAEKVFKDIFRTRGMTYSPDHCKQVATDAATDLITYYFVERKVRIDHFYTVTNWYVKKHLGWEKRGRHAQQRHWDSMVELPEDLSTKPNLYEPKEDPYEMLANHPYVIYELYRSKRFKQAIASILYKERETERWIIDNWRVLCHVYKVLHKRKIGKGSGRLG